MKRKDRYPDTDTFHFIIKILEIGIQEIVYIEH